VQTALSVKESLQLLSGNETYLVILDSNLNESQKLCEHLKCNIQTSLIPLILMYPKGTDIKKTDQFRICGNEYVIQPFEVKAILATAENELTRSAEEEAVFLQEVLFQFPTEDGAIDRANELGAQLFKASGLSDEGQVALCAAFREGVGNAAQHGNKHRRDKILEVLYLLDREKITVAVTDMGQGFDWSKYLDQGRNRNALDKARESHRVGKLGGLGIMLMLKCVDRLEYNDAGNVVTLTKFLKKK
jgi:anti-sigma regulatory factor (Ser/Thr protein kinase)/CheY-like chemotaxis protein